MSERIRELAEQAGFYYTDKTGFIAPAGCDPAKFAKLIIKDNLQTLRGNGYDDAAQCLQDINFGLDHPV